MPSDRPRLPDHWDPAPHERAFYRHAMTGDLGWIVRRNGRERVRLDRPEQEIIKPFNAGEWVRDADHRPISRHQIAQVAFAADRQLLAILGEYEEARVEWLALADDERIDWMERGPDDHPLRKALYQQITELLETSDN